MSTNPHCMKSTAASRHRYPYCEARESSAMLNIAGTRFRSISARHVGRRSGREYATPVTAFPLGDGFVIALLYGDLATVDWCRNVIAAAHAPSRYLGRISRWNDRKSYRHQMFGRCHPPFWRYMLEPEKIDQFLGVHLIRRKGV